MKRHFYLFVIFLITSFWGSCFRLYYECVVSYTSPFIRLIKRFLGTSHIPFKISFISSMISNFSISIFLTTTKHQNHQCGAGVAPLVQVLEYGVRLPATAEIYCFTTAFTPITVPSVQPYIPCTSEALISGDDATGAWSCLLSSV
jgi:hypothetical protein